MLMHPLRCGGRASRPAADRALFASLARRSRSPLKRSPPSVTIPSRRASGTGSTAPDATRGNLSRTPPADRRIWAHPRSGMRVSISLTSQSTGRSHRLKDARSRQFSAVHLAGAVRKSGPPRAASGGRCAILDPMLDLPVAGLRHQDEGDHDMAHNTLMLFAQLSGLWIRVLASRLGCDTELACVSACNFDPVSGVIGIQF